MLVQLLLPGFHFQTLPQSSPSDRELTPFQMSQAGQQCTSSPRLDNWHTLATFWLPARLRSHLLYPSLSWLPHELELRPGGTHIIMWPRDRALLSHSPAGLMSHSLAVAYGYHPRAQNLRSENRHLSSCRVSLFSPSLVDGQQKASAFQGNQKSVRVLLFYFPISA